MTWCGSTAKAVGKIQRFETSWLYGLINIFFRNAFAVFGHKSALLSTLVLHPTPPPQKPAILLQFASQEERIYLILID